MYLQLTHGHATRLYPSGEMHRDLSIRVRLPVGALLVETVFADLLSGPSAEPTHRIISRTVDHPEERFQAQDIHIGELLLDSLRKEPNWALWRPYCSCNS